MISVSKSDVKYLYHNNLEVGLQIHPIMMDSGQIKNDMTANRNAMIKIKRVISPCHHQSHYQEGLFLSGDSWTRGPARGKNIPLQILR